MATATICLQICAYEPASSGVRQNARIVSNRSLFMPLSPEALRANGDVAERLSASDFTLESGDHEPGWFSIDGVDDVRQIGSDGSGGAFVLLPTGNVLYASSEGRAGTIARNFEEFVRLIAACPYWLDVLKFSAGGDIDEMRRAADALEAVLDDEDDVNEARDLVRTRLGLPEADDPVGALYAAVAESATIVRAGDGSPFTTLFNRYSIDDNPMLRDAAA
jgi:hypothetical protein